MSRVLTFDLEEWFHLLDNPSTRSESQWTGFEPRLEENTERILNLLDRHRVTATFFCLGWVAGKYPNVVRRIVAAGHEIEKGFKENYRGIFRGN